LPSTKIDEDVDQRVEVDDCLLISEFRSFDAKLFGLAVDPLGGSPLIVDFFVPRCLSVDKMPDNSPGFVVLRINQPYDV